MDTRSSWRGGQNIGSTGTQVNGAKLSQPVSMAGPTLFKTKQLLKDQQEDMH
jgi:hypothetical protein